MPDTHDNDPKQAAPPRQPEPGEVLYARPLKGKINHAELTREHMARFPKIIAALARYERKCRTR